MRYRQAMKNRSLLNLNLFSHLKHVLLFHVHPFYVRQFHVYTFSWSVTFMSVIFSAPLQISLFLCLYCNKRLMLKVFLFHG